MLRLIQYLTIFLSTFILASMQPGKEILFPDWDLDTIVRSLSPARDDEVSHITSLLQEDKITEAVDWLRIETSRYPWIMLAAAYASMRQNLPEEAKRWLRAVTLIATDTLVQLWAWHNLRILGVEPPVNLAKKVLGVIVEVPNQGGEDIIASYADGTARFLSYTGAMIIWDDYHEQITPLIHEGIKLAHPVGELHFEHKTKQLADGDVRLTVLTSGGMYSWEGEPEDGSDIARLFARQAVLLKILIQTVIKNRSD
jgi:hypothetical protein